MSNKPPILFLHGMWSRPWVWEPWQVLFEAAGYRTQALCFPGHEAAAGEAVPTGLGRLSVADYVAAAMQSVRACDAPPIVIGHSMGGLVAQMLAANMHDGTGEASVSPASKSPLAGASQHAACTRLAAVVGVCAAAPGAVFPLRLAALPGTARHFANPLLWRSAFKLSAWEAKYLLFNAMPAAQADACAAQLVHESGRAAYQLAFGPLNLAGSNRVDKSRIRTPMLLLAGVQDRIVPIGASRATARWYGPLAASREYPQHAHWPLAEPGYESVVADVLAWLDGLALG